jgi:hypothetical protein
MKRVSRITMTGHLAFGSLVLAGTSWGRQRPPVAERLAKTYGLDSFGQIETIRHTFNVEFPAVKLSESWDGNPRPAGSPTRGKMRRASR